MLARIILSVVIGAGLGFGFWASPYASTIYGALLGFLFGR